MNLNSTGRYYCTNICLSCSPFKIVPTHALLDAYLKKAPRAYYFLLFLFYDVMVEPNGGSPSFCICCSCKYKDCSVSGFWKLNVVHATFEIKPNYAKMLFTAEVKVATKNKVPLVRSLTLNWLTCCIEASNKPAVLKVHKEYVSICIEVSELHAMIFM